MLLVTSFHNIIVVTISCMRSYHEEIFDYNAQGLSYAYIRLLEDKANLTPLDLGSLLAEFFIELYSYLTWPSCLRSYYKEISDYNAIELSCANIRLVEDKDDLLIWGFCLLSFALNWLHILHGLYV